MYFCFVWLAGLTQALLWLGGAASAEGLKDAVLLSGLAMLPVWWFPGSAHRWSGLVIVLTALLAVPGLAYFLVYRQELTQSLMMVLFESNQMESQEYLHNYFSWWIIVALIGFVVLPLSLWYWHGKSPRISGMSGAKLGLVSLLVLVAALYSPLKQCAKGDWHAAKQRLNKHLSGIPPFQLALGYLNYRKQLGVVEASLLNMRALPPLGNLQQSPALQQDTVVLVIGESTSRLHMQLYGYPRQTNPELSGIKHELSVFDQVYSPRPNTIESLQQVLTFADQHHPETFKSRPSLIAMMKQAGYYTFWVTNQQTLTGRNTMLTTFARQTDRQFFLNHSRQQNAYSFDEKVLDPFARCLQDPHPKKLIVVHLLGTHMKYSFRYPPQFNHFRKRDGLPQVGLDGDKVAVINSYDNAVRYNDWIMSQLIQRLKQRGEQNSLLIYFSDHGEEVYDTPPHQFQGRLEASPTLPMYSIPFLVWHSPARWNASALDNTAYHHRQYDNADFIYTLADMSGIRFDGFAADESLINPQFAEDTIWVGDPYLGKLKPLAGTRMYSHPTLASWHAGSPAQH